VTGLVPTHVVSAWLGNAVCNRWIAEKHYVQVLDSHFENARLNPTLSEHVLSCSAATQNQRLPEMQGNAENRRKSMGGTGFDTVRSYQQSS
jgi:hypothetical protein